MWSSRFLDKHLADPIWNVIRCGLVSLGLFTLAGCDQRTLDAIGAVIVTLILVAIALLVAVHLLLVGLLVTNISMLRRGRPNAALGVVTIVVGLFEWLAMLYIALDPAERAPLHGDDSILTGALIFGFGLASGLVVVGAISFKHAVARAASIAPVVPEIEPPLTPQAPPRAKPPAPPNTLGAPWP